MKKYFEILLSSAYHEVIEAIANGEEGFKDIYEEAVLITLEHGDSGICRIIIAEDNLNWIAYLQDIADYKETTFLCFIRATWLNDPIYYQIRIVPDGLVLEDLNVISILTSDSDKAWSLLEMVQFDDAEKHNN